MINLPLPKSGIINSIVHISDIHIRIGDEFKSRVNEYEYVFDNLINELSTLNDVKNNSAVCIITGDLFEYKNKLDSYSVKLFGKLINNISDLMPLYVFHGNHDYRQDNPDIPDIITSLLSLNSNNNIFNMKKTGLYLAGNVGFGYVDIKETSKLYSTESGHINELPKFPNPKLFPKNTTTIALFHGTITKSTMQNYTEASNGIPIEWFNKYNLGLFGDVHLQQVHNVDNNGDFSPNSITWGYSGSLVQQNFGEPLMGHGYLLWDINNKKVSKHHIKSNNGMFYVLFKDNNWYGIVNNVEILLSEFINKENIPNNLNISIKGKYKHENLENLYELLKNKKFNIKKNFSNFVKNNETEKYTNEKSSIDLSLVNGTDKWKEYINIMSSKEENIDLTYENWKDWIDNPETLLLKNYIVNPEEFINTRDTKLEKLILNFNEKSNELDIKQRNIFKIVEIKWNWLFCYGKNNHVNFRELKNKLNIINGPNDAGKSSFLDIICYSIFGEGIPSRYNKQYSGNLICNKKPEKETSNTELYFTIGNSKYLLARTFYKKTNGQKQSNQEELFLIKENNNRIKIGSGVNKNKEWVSSNIGTIDDFLLTCMLTQSIDKEFFSLKSGEQLDFFDKFLKLENINSFVDILRESINSHKYIRDVYDGKIETLSKPDKKVLISIEKEITDCDYNIDQLEKDDDKIKETWHSVYKIEDLELDEVIINQNIKKYESKYIDTIFENKNIIKYQLNNFETFETFETFNTIEIGEDLENIIRELSKLNEYVIIKPSVSIEIVEKELKSNNIVEDSINTDNLLDNKQKLQILMESPLNKPIYSIDDYNNFMTEYNKIMCEITDAQYTKDKLLSIEIKPYNNNLIKTDIISNINNITTKLGDYLHLVQLNDDVLNEKLEKLEKLEKENIILSEKRNSIELIIKNLQNDYINLKEINKPSMTIDYINEKLDYLEKTDIKKYKSDYEKLNNIVNKNNEINNQLLITKNRINEIESYNHPFNEKCSACNNQLWKKELINLILNKNTLESSLQDSDIIEEYNTRKNNIREIISKYESAYLIKDSLILDKENIKCYEKYYNEKSSFISQIKILQEELDVQKDKLYFCTDELIACRYTKDIKKTLNILQYSLKEVEEYETMKSIYLLKDKFVILENKLPIWKEQYKIINDHEKYLFEIKELKNTIDIQEKVLKFREFSKIKKEWIDYDNYTSKLTKFEKKILELKLEIIENNEKYKYWTGVMSTKKDFTIKQHHKSELKILNENKIKLNSKLNKEQDKINRYSRQTEANKKLVEILESTESRMACLIKLIEIMAGFRTWLYKEHILPILIKETNDIIELATHTDEYKLMVDIGEKLDFSWFINDIPINTSGGFRRFISELSLRIAITKIGASSVHCDQLFIDEGFVSADTNNLEKIPNFLKDLLYVYDTIIVVSHLEILKECDDIKKINIVIKEDNLRQLYLNSEKEKEVDIKFAEQEEEEEEEEEVKVKVKVNKETNSINCKGFNKKKEPCKFKGIHNGYCVYHKQ